MGEIRFVTDTRMFLDDRLLNQIYDVVAPSMRSNAKFYYHSSIEDALKAYEPQRFRQWAEPFLFSVFAYDGNRLVGNGFLKYRKFRDDLLETESGYLFGGFVDPAYHRKGIGKEILKRRIDHAKALGIKVLRANASEASLKMAQRMGAAEIGVHVDETLKNLDGTPAKLHLLEYRLQ